MASNTYKSNTFKAKNSKKKTKNSSFVKDRRFHLAFGFFLQVSSLFLFIAFVSYLFTGKADQSVVEAVGATGLKASGLESENWLGLLGALTADLFVFKWFGVASFLIPPLLFIWGYKIVFKKTIVPLPRAFIFSFFFLFWLSLLMGYFQLGDSESSMWSFVSGGIGFELAVLSDSLIGTGTFLLLIFLLLVFIIFYFNITSLLGFGRKIESTPQVGTTSTPVVENTVIETDQLDAKTEITEEEKEAEVEQWEVKNLDEDDKKENSEEKQYLEIELNKESPETSEESEPDFSIEEKKS